jgi:hypothetical protein
MSRSRKTLPVILRGVVIAGTALAVTPAHAPQARADDIRAAVMLIEMGETAAPATAATAAKLAPAPLAGERQMGAKTQSWILRQILGLKNAAAKSLHAPVETGALQSGPRKEAAQPAKMLLAEADPNYKLWQSHADEKLKHEHSLANPKENPVAATYPDSFVVVCEAGCRGETNHIVYMVSKAAAATGLKTSWQPSSSESAEDVPAAQVASAVSTTGDVVDDPRSLPCVAGCYDRPEPNARSQIKKAEVAVPPEPPILAVAVTAALPGVREMVAKPIVSRKLTSIARLRTKPKATRLGRPKANRSWHATVIRNIAVDDDVRAHHHQLDRLKRSNGEALRHRKFVSAMQRALR